VSAASSGPGWHRQFRGWDGRAEARGRLTPWEWRQRWAEGLKQQIP
jgi:hypothetical protein